MTFILVTKVMGIPMIFGDLLISQENNPNNHDIDTPIYRGRQIDQIIPRQVWFHSIIDMSRKVIKINDKLVIAWSGTYIAAKTVISELIENFTSYYPTMSELIIYLREVPYLGKDVSLVLMGWVVDRDSPRSFCYDFDNKNLSTDKEWYAAGGGDKLVKKLQRIPLMHKNIEGFEKSIHKAIALTINIIGHDVFTGEVTNGLYGGYIEFMYIENGIFRYPEKILHTFWSIDGIDNLYIPKMVDKFIESWYEGEKLIIRTTEFYSEGMVIDISNNSRMYHMNYLEPYNVQRDVSEIIKNSYESSYYAHFIKTLVGKTLYAPYCLVFRPEDIGHLIHVHNDHPNISFDIELLRWMETLARRIVNDK